MVDGVKKDNIIKMYRSKCSIRYCGSWYIAECSAEQVWNSEDKELKFSVPQGSCVGPVLYSAYASTLQEVVPLDLYGYANDHGLKTKFLPVPECEAKAIADTEKCLTDIKTWMDHN